MIEKVELYNVQCDKCLDYLYNEDGTIMCFDEECLAKQTAEESGWVFNQGYLHCQVVQRNWKKMTEGPIKWQTGKGHEFNYECLVTVRDRNGETYVDTDFWDVHLNEWSFHNKHTGCEVIAWCKVEDVEPYKITEE